ncbi:MAG: hypothetical protein RMM29_08985 [Planctomycetota bacterium]|nr:AsmA-like C-terminal region-containing protein [Planctomycetota bacterium]MCX8040385.1 AsmA-like C-terminal region-containing protein [Planctomycetota bacterium]MDW8373761.1 hypothetical protein [Planctomycetota bacterium]
MARPEARAALLCLGALGCIGGLSAGDSAGRVFRLAIDGDVLHANALEIAGLAFRDIVARPRLRERRLWFEDLAAQAYGGRVRGRYGLDLEPDAAGQRAHSLQFEVSGVDLRLLLQSLGASAAAQVEGRISGSFELTMPLDGGPCSGRGTIEIADASLVQLPFLVNFLAGNPVAARGRDRLTAIFFVIGESIHVQWLTLDSPVLQLSAHGRIGFDGRLNLVLLPRLPFELVRQLPVLGDLLASGLGRLTGNLSRAVVRGHVRQPVIVFDAFAR